MISFWSWEKSKFELLSKSIALKRALNEKQAELDQCLKENKRLLEEMKNTSVMFNHLKKTQMPSFC